MSICLCLQLRPPPHFLLGSGPSAKGVCAHGWSQGPVCVDFITPRHPRVCESIYCEVCVCVPFLYFILARETNQSRQFKSLREEVCATPLRVFREYFNVLKTRCNLLPSKWSQRSECTALIPLFSEPAFPVSPGLNDDVTQRYYITCQINMQRRMLCLRELWVEIIFEHSKSFNAASSCHNKLLLSKHLQVC